MRHIACSAGTHMRWVVTLLFLLATTARADPATVLVGFGIRHAWLHDPLGPRLDERSGALATTLAVRIAPHLAVGVHVGATQKRGQDGFVGNMVGSSFRWNVTGIDLAVGVEYDGRRIRLMPWIGRRLSRLHQEDTVCRMSGCTTTEMTDWTDDVTTFGVTTSVDLARSIALFLDAQTSVGQSVVRPIGEPQYRYSAATFGLAYRR